VKLVFVQTMWTEHNGDFAADAFDIAVGGVTNLPPREAVGPFARTLYVDGKRPIARRADQARFTGIAAINRPEVRVVVNPGASNEAFARQNFPATQLTVHGDNATVFQEIVAGRADVMVTDGIEVDHEAYISKCVLCPTAVDAPFTRLEKAYWLRPDAEFQAAIDSWLADEIASGSWQRSLETALAVP
jgi:cyclohexadienyl dehydratase